MTNEEKLQKIISAYTSLEYSKIDLKKDIQDNYVPTEFKMNFCNDICEQWHNVNINSTQLHNDMFVNLKTGEDILKIFKYIK
jgi:hypothetical protein